MMVNQEISKELPDDLEWNRWVQTFKPAWGIVLGSGLGELVDRIDVAFILPFKNVEGIPASKVSGHAGRFVFAHIGKTPVVVAQGRSHIYEGFSAFEVTAGIRFMGSLGIKKLILTNAAGTLTHPPGTWMILNDHLNLTGASPLTGRPAFIDMTCAYSVSLRQHFLQIAQDEGITLHEGIYAGVPGPQYETPAEVRMLRTLGANAVGMSTVLETIQARSMGIEVAAFSCLTNWAAGMNPEPINHAEVLKIGRESVNSLMRFVERGISLPF